MAATGQADLESAVSSIPDGSKKLLVITSGDKGSEVRSRGRRKRAEGFRVPLLKGLGGGDGFIAGFLYGHLQGWPPEKAAFFGNAVGAIVVMGHACSESMPKLARVSSFLRKNGYSFSPDAGPFKR
jgi:sugar/nucleoside kinase (ribokinase family)